MGLPAGSGLCLVDQRDPQKAQETSGRLAFVHKGTEEVDTIMGEHTNAVQSIRVHERISEILAMTRVRDAQKESYGLQP